MIRQFQDAYFESCYESSVWGYSTPDFEAVAQAYGIPAKTIARTEEIDGGLKFLWTDPEKPALLNVIIDVYTNTYPKTAFGKPLTNMDPEYLVD